MMPIVMAIVDVVVAVMPILSDIAPVILEILAIDIARRETILQLSTALLRQAVIRPDAWTIISDGALANTWAIPCTGKRTDTGTIAQAGERGGAVTGK